MSSRVIVRLAGRVGLDDVDRLLKELEIGTALDWNEEPDPDAEPRLSVEQIILTALLSGMGAKTTETVISAVQEAVRRWQERRLDPPDAEVEIREDTDTDPDQS